MKVEGCQGIDGDSSVVQEDAEVVENSAWGLLAISVDPHCNAWKIWRGIRKDGCWKMSAQKGEEQAGHSILDDLCHDVEMLRHLTEGQGVEGDSGWILKM